MKTQSSFFVRQIVLPRIRTRRHLRGMTFPPSVWHHVSWSLAFSFEDRFGTTCALLGWSASEVDQIECTQLDVGSVRPPKCWDSVHSSVVGVGSPNLSLRRAFVLVELWPSSKSPCGLILMMHRVTRQNIFRRLLPDLVCAARRGPHLVYADWSCESICPPSQTRNGCACRCWPQPTHPHWECW